MATAEELLASDQCEDILWINLDSRVIEIPSRVTNIGVESDEDVLKLHFAMRRMYHGTDLSTFSFRINYKNANGEDDVYDVTDPIIEEDRISFDWTVGRHACTAKGDVEFSACIKKFDGDLILQEFNTTTAILPVLKGLETGKAIIEESYDLLEQWKNRLFGAGDTVEQNIANAGTVELEKITNAGATEFEKIVNAGDAVEENITNAGDSERKKIVNAGNLECEKVSNAADAVLQSIMDTTSSKLQDVVDTGDNIEQSITDTSETQLSRIRSLGDIIDAELLETGDNIDKSLRERFNEYETDLTNTHIGIEEDIRIFGDGVKESVSDSVEAYISSHYDELRGETITSIIRTSGAGLPGTTDVYTITTSADKTYTFSIYNGKDGINSGNGSGSGDMAKSVYDPQSKNTDIFAYVDERINSITSVFDTIKDELSTV